MAIEDAHARDRAPSANGAGLSVGRRELLDVMGRAAGRVSRGLRPRSPRYRQTGCRSSRNASTATSFAALKTHGAVPPRSPASRASASSGNASRSGAWNSSVSRGEVERRHRRRRPLRVRERVRDRNTHVRVAEVRQRRAVAEAHDRVHDRRRVHHDLQPVVREAEQEVRLDQLEALVRERRGVDGDLRAHVPGRMGKRLLGRHVGQLVGGPAAKRPARGREHERVHGLAVPLPDTGTTPSARSRREAAGLLPAPGRRALARPRRRDSPCSRAQGRRRPRATRAWPAGLRSRRRR